MSLDIAALRAEYAEWKAQRTDITASQRVLSVFRARPLTAAQAYEALGISNQGGSRLLANAITNLCQLGLLSADASRPRRYRFMHDCSQPVPAAKRAQLKAEAKARTDARKALSHKRREQAAVEKQSRIAAAARKASAKPVVAQPRKQSPAAANETTEQFIARGGNYQVLPHNFDTRRTSFPGRRPVIASTRTHS